MKKLVTKFFLFGFAVLAISESIFFFMVIFRPIPTGDIISFYTFILETPKVFHITLGVAIFFLSLGIILFFLALQVKGPQKLFLIREKGEILRIPVDTIGHFIDQILSQSPYMSDCDTMISSKRERMNIDIFSSFKQAVPIRQEVSRVRAVLREEIERVFGFTNFKINFQMKNINIDQSRNSNRFEFVNEEQVEDGATSLEHVLTPKKEEEPENGKIIEEAVQKKIPHKLMPWE